MYFYLGPHQLVQELHHKSESNSFARNRQRVGRSSVHKDTTIPRMGISGAGGPEVIPLLAGSRDRLVCNIREQGTVHVLFPQNTSPGTVRDALNWHWTGRYVYAFPPLPLIKQVLRKVEEEQVMMILIAPRWTRREWFPLLLDLLIDYPLRLPVIQDLVTQQSGTLLHHNPAELQLLAWMISRVNSLQQDFHNRLQKQSWQLGARTPTRLYLRLETLL